MTFEQRINSIENGMLRLLEHGDSAISQPKMTGVRTFDFYSGQLDAETDEQLKKILNQLKEDFPLVLIGYTDGKDEENPAKGRRPGISLDFRHDCSFVVFCLASNPRGLREQKRPARSNETGVIKMVSEVREKLAGVQFVLAPDGTVSVLTKMPAPDDPRVVLNTPLLPKGNEHIAKIQGLTVMAVIFDTSFRWSTTDRSAAGVPVENLTIEVGVKNQPIAAQTNRPGVVLR